MTATEDNDKLAEAYSTALARFEAAGRALALLGKLEGEEELAGIERLRETRRAATEARLIYEAMRDRSA